VLASGAHGRPYSTSTQTRHLTTLMWPNEDKLDLEGDDWWNWFSATKPAKPVKPVEEFSGYAIYMDYDSAKKVDSSRS